MRECVKETWRAQLFYLKIWPLFLLFSNTGSRLVSPSLKLLLKISLSWLWYRRFSYMLVSELRSLRVKFVAQPMIISLLANVRYKDIPKGKAQPSNCNSLYYWKNLKVSLIMRTWQIMLKFLRSWKDGKQNLSSAISDLFRFENIFFMTIDSVQIYDLS